AVEMDYFTDGAGGNSVLVPRTAFIPSWIASGEAADRRRSTAPYNLAVAAPEVRSLIEHMDDLARDLDLRVRPAPAGPHYHPAIREPGVSFSMGVGIYATRLTAEFNILAFRELGEDSIADNMLERIRRVTGMTKLPRSWPAIPCW